MNTLFDKIWDLHVVQVVEDGPSVIFIDRQYIHEVTSPQAFDGLRKRKIKIFRPKQISATADHNVPTKNQHLPIADLMSRTQIEMLEKNCKENDIEYYGLLHKNQGIVHVIGPELGLTQPGMTIVCGDSHTSTHGAFGTIAFGIGTSEVEMVMASQCLLQSKPKQMKIEVNGKLGKYVTAKDIILYIISRLTSAGATGYFAEYCGSTIRSLSMDERMTICNMSIEMGARGGLIAPDETTFRYLKNREFIQKESWNEYLNYWKILYTDDDAEFDKIYTFDSSDIEPMITYGTNPGMGIKINKTIPFVNSIYGDANKSTFLKALEYMGFRQGTKLIGHPVKYVFVGSCTNGRLEDIRVFANAVKGKRKAENVWAMVVPGSMNVIKQAKEEGLDKIIRDAGIDFHEPGCSACLAMNEDKVPKGEICVSTSNRNFEGRQGPGSRTILASPIVAAAVALTGKITDPRDILNI